MRHFKITRHGFLFSQILREVDSNEVTLSQVVMSHSGRMLFAGTGGGALRCLKFPLQVPGEWQELMGHNAAITKVTYAKLITIVLNCIMTALVVGMCDTKSLAPHFRNIQGTLKLSLHRKL